MAFHPRVLWYLLLFAFVLALPLGSHLFDALLPGRWRGAFIELACGRAFLFFAVAAECALWYQFRARRLATPKLSVPQ